MVTDQIDTFTEKGLELESGAELEADLIVTATGLNLQLFGGIMGWLVGNDSGSMFDTLFISFPSHLLGTNGLSDWIVADPGRRCRG